MHYSVTECLRKDYWATGAFVKLPDWHSWPPFYSVRIRAICVSKTCSWFTVYCLWALQCIYSSPVPRRNRISDQPQRDERCALLPHIFNMCSFFPMKIPIKPLNILSKKTRLKPARTHQQHRSQRSVWIFVERCDAVRETFRVKGSV